MRRDQPLRAAVLRSAALAALSGLGLYLAVFGAGLGGATDPGAGGTGETSSWQAPGHLHALPLAATLPAAPTLARTGWTVSATSEETVAESDAAVNVLDGVAATLWHSKYSSGTMSLPVSITLDMHVTQPVSALVYTPRVTSPNGRIGQYQVDVSTDGAGWGSPVATGTWADDETVKTASFAVVSARFVRLTALTEAGGRGLWASAGELNLLGAPTAPPPADPSAVGSWGPMIGFPLVPSAAALLPGNRVLLWASGVSDNFNVVHGQTQTAILDLTTGVVGQRLVTNTGHDMFCPGVAILPDGKVMVTGGSDSRKTSIYDPVTDSWSAGPDLVVPRGYQGQTLLPSGEVFTIGGSWSGGLGGKIGEVWSAAGGWRGLSGVPADPILTADPQGIYRSDNHAWLFPLSAGRLLQAGPGKQLNWITTAGNGSITSAGPRADSADAMNGNAVYYDIDKIFTTGGATAYENADATGRSYVIDVRGTTPVVTRTGDLASPRAFHNSVVLPNGQVVTVGGQARPVTFSDQTAALNAELWDPLTGRFTTMAAMAEPRTYHSWALLLPDGRVLSGGGGLCGPCTTNHPSAQIFTPPYLLNPDGTARPRPRLTSAPATAVIGSSITVGADSAITQFALVRYGEATHSVDNDQRRIPLRITSTAGTAYTLALPADPGILLPGPYLLFGLNAAGVPSVASTVMVGAAATAGTNLAAGRPASQSSVAYGGDPGRAVDGSTDGSWGAGSVTHTDWQAQPWWQVDLGAASAVSRVQVWNRTDCCAARLSNAVVFVSTADMTGRTLAALQADPAVRSVALPAFSGAASVSVNVGGTGRFVRVQLSGSDYLSLAEVQVYGSAGPPAGANLAAGRPASQSSVAYGGDPGRAVDGNTDGSWGAGSVTHTDWQAQPWWQVDLGVVSSVSRVQVWNRTDCCAARLSNAVVFVSTADMTGRTLAALQADPAVRSVALPAFSGAASVSVNVGGTGRFVRVQLSGSDYLSLAEVQVYGS